MSGNNARGAEKASESISRASSITLVSPEANDPMANIVTMLKDIDGLIPNLYPKGTGNLGDVPDKKALLQEITKVSEDVKRISLAQSSQIKSIKDEIQKNTKTQIVETVGVRIQSLIDEAVDTQTKKGMEDWAKKYKPDKFVDALQGTANGNDTLLAEANITLENSISRHANSTLDLQDDFNAKLKTIRRQDGHVSEDFPTSLRELFSYDSERLLGLIRDYGLRPLDKHTENLTRFLMFIGMNQAIPDQLINISDEQPPAYGNATETEGEKNSRGARRGGQQDPKAIVKPSWPWLSG